MIRVNLLSSGRASAKKTAGFFERQQLAFGCALILLAAGGYVGWRYWTLTAQSTKLDADIAAAQKETVRLHSIIVQVQQFEQRKGQLQQRVALIEQLRREQTGPVHMLDQISRALPPLLWLTDLKQAPGANEVLIDGRSTTMTGLSDFVANLEASGYFQRSIEIVSSTTETNAAAGGELIKFQIKAVFQRPAEGKSAAAGGTATPGAEVKPRS